MSHRIHTLELKLIQARTNRDEALLELRMMKARTSNDPQVLAEQFVKDFRDDAKQRRAKIRDRSSLDDFMEWIGNASSVWSGELCRYLEGDVRQLALAEIKLIAANGITCALNQELTRTTAEYSVHQFLSA